MESIKGSKETVYTFIATIASKIFTYILLVILANIFAKEVYGQAAFVMSVFDLTVFLGTIGVPHILSPWISKNKEVHSVFIMLMSISLIFMFAGLLLSIKYPLIIPIVLMYPVLFLRNIAGSYLQSNFKYHINQIAGDLYILFALIFVLIFKNLQTPGIILAYAFGHLGSAILVLYCSWNDMKKLFSKLHFNLNTIKLYLKKSTLTSILFISFLFLKWIDTSILGLLSTFASVASYNVAAPIANSVTIISVPLSFYLLSKIPRVKNKEKSISILKTALRISFSMSLIALIAINSLSHLIIKIFFPKYIGVEIYVMLLSLGIIFYSLYGPIYYYISGKLHPEIGFSSIVTAAVLNIILDIIFIPFFDIYGIAIATSISHLVAFTILFRKLKILKEFIPAYFTLIFIALAYYTGSYGLLLLLVAVPFLYSLQLFKKEDFSIIKNTLFSIAKLK